MDILYIIGTGSKWNNNELKYSLRGIAKNGINIDRVFIVGSIPDFVNKETVICIPLEDPTEIKHYNMLYKIDYVISHTDIGKNNDGNFLVSSDDHFYIKPTDFNIYPFYWRGAMLPDESKRKPGNKYQDSLISTRKVLESYNLPYYKFNWHGNTYFNTKLWNDPMFKEIREKSLTVNQGLEPTAIMLNYWLKVKPFQFVHRKDCKFKFTVSEDKFHEKIKDREVFSTYPNIHLGLVAKWLQKEFPDKCKYEI